MSILKAINTEYNTSLKVMILVTEYITCRTFCFMMLPEEQAVICMSRLRAI